MSKKKNNKDQYGSEHILPKVHNYHRKDDYDTYDNEYLSE